ncbi:MAG: hypothetical protein II873_09895 [Oscillospiraceae bacterium]|nr:hypothetical protein [Oscillospiraceae bacterium]
MEYIEANPLPQCCKNCTEPDEGCCDECDHLGERFVLSEADRKQLNKLVEQRIKKQQAREENAGVL